MASRGMPANSRLHARLGDQTLFRYGDSALPAGIALHAADFIVADDREVVAELTRFVRGVCARRVKKTEIESWRTGIPLLKDVLRLAGIPDVLVLLEAVVPHGRRRIDCMLIGADHDAKPCIVILELKGWSDACEVPGTSLIMPTYGPWSPKSPGLHPSIQALGYMSQLSDLLVACHEVVVKGAAWLPHMPQRRMSGLSEGRFEQAAVKAPLFGAEDARALSTFIVGAVPKPAHDGFLQAVNASAVQLASSVMRDFATSSSRNGVTAAGTGGARSLASNIVNLFSTVEQRVVLVRWLPGRGKTFVPLQLMTAFCEYGIGALYAAAPAAIRTHHRALYPDSPQLFADVLSVAQHGSARKTNVLIVDEAHRIDDRNVILECVQSAQLTVFFIDDHELVIPGDLANGSKDLRTTLKKGGISEHCIYELDIGGDGSYDFPEFVRFIEGCLRIASPGALSAGSGYSFAVASSPQEMERTLADYGGSWRLLAGSCYNRIPSCAADEFPRDVELPEFDYVRPWQGNEECLAPGTPLYDAEVNWRCDPLAQFHVGDVHSAPNLEFDYVGVIFRRDLFVRNGQWKFDLSLHSHKDILFNHGIVHHRGKDVALRTLTHTYRHLLTRGRKGCVVFFEDSETRCFFEHEMNRFPHVAHG